MWILKLGQIGKYLSQRDVLPFFQSFAPVDCMLPKFSSRSSMNALCGNFYKIVKSRCSQWNHFTFMKKEQMFFLKKT